MTNYIVSRIKNHKVKWLYTKTLIDIKKKTANELVQTKKFYSTNLQHFYLKLHFCR